MLQRQVPRFAAETPHPNHTANHENRRGRGSARSQKIGIAQGITIETARGTGGVTGPARGSGIDQKRGDETAQKTDAIAQGTETRKRNEIARETETGTRSETAREIDGATALAPNPDAHALPYPTAPANTAPRRHPPRRPRSAGNAPAHTRGHAPDPLATETANRSPRKKYPSAASTTAPDPPANMAALPPRSKSPTSSPRGSSPKPPTKSKAQKSA